MLVHFECPECKGLLCEIWSLNSSDWRIRFAYRGWLWNPGLAVNELILGQKMPEQIFFCKSCTSAKYNRSYIYCPNCYRFINSRFWSYGKAFGHWLGIFCPLCGGQIPTLLNFTSRLLLAIAWPILWLPRKLMHTRLLVYARNRALADRIGHNNELQVPVPKGSVSYTRMGFLFALFTNLIVAFGLTIAIASTVNSSQMGNLDYYGIIVCFLMTFLGGLIVSIPAGFFFAYSMRLVMDRKGDREMHLTLEDPMFSEKKIDNPPSLPS